MADITHPAKFSDPVLAQVSKFLPSGALVLDPFAGMGLIHSLSHVKTIGVEIEPEWASVHPNTIIGDALTLPFPDSTFDAIATSPVYGNRMSDSFEAKDKSRRITYRHCLGRSLHLNNSGQLQWGPKYKEFHIQAWKEATRVLKPEGRFILNVSDHIRKGSIKAVSIWHVAEVLKLQYRVLDWELVRTQRMRMGQNAKLRVEHENVILFQKKP